MTIPMDITFKNLEHSAALEAKIRERGARLELHGDTIQRCRVVVQGPHKHHNKGGLYEVRIDVRVPGEELVVSRGGHRNQAHEDPYVAVRDAFDAMTQQLDSRKRRPSNPPPRI
ncbi:MAG: HPF/RaiA family ribosome-associated protein [Myxococcales bacterium]|nr:HPF/RaiA family ribosome-associated protein [Myxococcales bacterium]MDD9968816.1 HPF/RaiA family ribosome-associated protein [Myxococcales bacterium]